MPIADALLCSDAFQTHFYRRYYGKELYLSTNPRPAPTAQQNRTLRKIIALVATLGGLLFGYDTGVVSGALLFMRSDLHLTPFTTGLVTSSLLFGAAFGALLAGHFADALGRRKIIITLAFIFALGAVGSAFAPDVVTMIASRLFLGIAVGGAAATVPVYIAEIAPANKRGQLVTLQELMIVSGQLLAYVSNATFNEIWGGEHTALDAGHLHRTRRAVVDRNDLYAGKSTLARHAATRWRAQGAGENPGGGGRRVGAGGDRRDHRRASPARQRSPA